MEISLQSSQIESEPGIPTPRTESVISSENELNLPWSSILHTLSGVLTATKAATGEESTIIEAIETIIRERHIGTVTEVTNSKHVDGISFQLRDWTQIVESTILQVEARHRAKIALVVAFMCCSGRQSLAVSSVDLDYIWSIIFDVLSNSSIAFTVARSAQGFFAIPLASRLKDGNIEELFRLHVWLPDGKRGVADLAIHAHQPFAQSWILAGQGTDYTFEGVPAESDAATHAEYGVVWSSNSSEGSGKAYQVHQTSSTVARTGKLVCITPKTSETHCRDTTYSVPAGVLHRSQVNPDALHATLFFFDASRGFQQYAPVLGPVNGEPYTQQRDPAGITPSALVKKVEAVRAWELLYNQGYRHSLKAEWEEALRAFRSSLHICASDEDLFAAPQYKHETLHELGHMYRMLGRYQLAADTLEGALHDMPLCQERVDTTGELAVLYRHMNRLEDAKRAAEDEYDTAKYLGSNRSMCRAIGSVGMINYQLFLLHNDKSLLALAVAQLTERIQRSRQIKAEAQQLSDLNAQTQAYEYGLQREAIGLSRLSLCFGSTGEIDRAIETALEGLNIVLCQGDSTKIAISRYFYGRALLLAGRVQEALAQFNPSGTCTPIIALCKEPSDEHGQYIQEMIDAGADLELRDESGYSALECTMYSNDVATQEIIQRGLQKQFLRQAELKYERAMYEAKLRKGYRELFQDKLRPVLLSANGDNTQLKELRRAYADALNADAEKEGTFDGLKYVRYTDFLRSGRLPRSSDGFTQQIRLTQEQEENDDFILFFSYRWIAHDSGTLSVVNTPDDIHNTQYHRMLRAVNLFVELHRDIDIEKLCIWIDFACVDQDFQQPGVAALPMNLAQCNAMISLIDDRYYERSWCAVEVMMMQTIRKAYGIHIWYEHVIDPLQGREYLRPGPQHPEISVSNTKVTYESDRPKLLFLERQAKLLG